MMYEPMNRSQGFLAALAATKYWRASITTVILVSLPTDNLPFFVCLFFFFSELSPFRIKIECYQNDRMIIGVTLNGVVLCGVTRFEGIHG
jgi:hypothetical protein